MSSFAATRIFCSRSGSTSSPVNARNVSISKVWAVESLLSDSSSPPSVWLDLACPLAHEADVGPLEVSADVEVCCSGMSSGSSTKNLRFLAGLCSTSAELIFEAAAMENTGLKEPIKTQTRRRDSCAAHVTNFSLKVQFDFVIRP